jgi:peptide/nickel transport system substrate-binding protein
MNKEPVSLYIFRFITGLALLIFMILLYWSSTLIENDLKNLRGEISQLKSDLSTMRSDAEKGRSETLQTILKENGEWRRLLQYGVICADQAARHIKGKQGEASSKESSDEQDTLNLLRTDPFFEVTLPKLLGKNFIPRGIQHTATIGKPDSLHPFSNWSQVVSWHALCNVSVSQLEFGKYETMAPNMALRVEERINSKTSAPEFWVFIRDQVFWQPLNPDFFPSTVRLAPQFLRKNQVTAEDFKFFYDVLMNPYVQEPGAVSLRTYFGAIEEIEIVDKLTFIVRWQTKEVVGSDGKKTHKAKYIARDLTGSLRPLAGFVYKYFADGKKIIDDANDPNAYRTNSVWAQNFAEHWAKNVIVSCGPWIFDGMTERHIKFKRNPEFYFPLAALTEGIETSFKDSPDNIWQEFKNNQLDSCILQPNQLLELEAFLQSPAYKIQKKNNYAIRRLDYVGRSYTYIGWNEAKPYFQSAKVRQALTMAIDRRRIIQDYLNGLGIEITGTFYRYSPAYDTSIVPWPFNPEQAVRLLEEEGWFDSDGDGIIDKVIDGKRVPFRFSLTYYVKNPTTKSVCEYIATALKEIGIESHLNGVDMADLSAVFDDKSFDALCLGWVLGNPPDDPRQLWHSSGAKEKGSSNSIGFANAEIDKIIEALDYEYDPQKRIQLYHRFDAILHELQPYTFLYTPKIVMLYREFLQNVFLPIDRQDLIPGATIAEPDSSIFWIKTRNSPE